MIDDPQDTNANEHLGGPAMTLSEHLNELRARMIKALIGIGIVLAACLLYQDEIMWIVTGPHRKAMEGLKEKLAEDRESPKKGELTRAQKILAAIKRLRKKDPAAAAALELVAGEVVDLKEEGQKQLRTLKTLKYQEAFISYLKACFVAALILASPWVILQFWGFIAAGLYRHERRYAFTYLPFSFLAFVAGVVFGYFVLIPTGLTYLATYASPQLVSVQVTLGFYLSFVLILTVALGVVFQLPLVMMFLAKANVFTPGQYAKHRKYAVLIAVILGAALTPPDPVTQILLATPVFFLYELGIWLARLTIVRRPAAKAVCK